MLEFKEFLLAVICVAAERVIEWKWTSN